MKSSGPFLVLLLSLSSTASGLGSVVRRHYSYISEYLTWKDAQRYCRNLAPNTDLAPIFTQSDADSLNMVFYHAWTGLKKQVNTFWFWLYPYGFDVNLQQNQYWWGEPWLPSDNNNCAVVSYNNQRFYARHCDGCYFFFCIEYKNFGDYKYTFVPQSMSWSEARQYCMRKRDGYLATFIDDSDLYSTVINQDFPVWTGLYREGGTWRWSTGLSEYRKWAEREPGNDDCVSISSTSKRMSTQDCAARFPFLCFSDNLVLVKENKTWEGALEHCRALNSTSQPNLRYELVSVQPGGDHDHVMSRVMEADTDEVWAGLRFLAGEWLWVNGASMLYSDLPLCPPVVQHCGALSKNSTGSMETRDCSEKRNFMCYSTYFISLDGGRL